MSHWRVILLVLVVLGGFGFYEWHTGKHKTMVSETLITPCQTTDKVLGAQTMHTMREGQVIKEFRPMTHCIPCSQVTTDEEKYICTGKPVVK